MSTFKHPVGPQPRSVYWRRRLVVLIGLIAIVAIVVLLLVRPGASSGEPVAPAHTTSPPTPSAPASSGASPRPTASGAAPAPASTPAASSGASASGPGSAAGARKCNPSDVRVEAVTDKDSYAAGQLPLLSIAITNSGSSACTVDAGTAQQAFTITSGAEIYWQSTDCQADKSDAVVLLQPGKTISSQSPITWDRTRSSPSTCQAQRPQVPAGGASYHLKTAVGGVESSNTKQFILR